jgi:predicted ATPase
MLTRLEVNGFKNLVDFSLDFGPYTCIAGPNGVGKSNIFDAIRFLSLLTDHTINEAALQIRNAGEETGDIQDLLFYGGGERASRMEFAAEMIVGKDVRDDFGREAEASSSFLRYEVAFRYEPSSATAGPLGGLVLEREELRPIATGRAVHHLKFPHSKAKFRDSVVYNRRHARSGFISTQIDPETEQTAIVVHQDGGSHGRGRPSPAEGAARTIIGTENTTATPTILAAHREMQSWRVLALDPAAMRRPDRYTQPPGIAANGAHIPATLQHLSNIAPEHGDDPHAVFQMVSIYLSSLVPAQMVRVVRDEERQLLSLELEEYSGVKVRANAISDGALRFLALAAVCESCYESGVYCIEEPENGVYPDQLAAVNRLLHNIAVEIDEPVGIENPMRQVIVITHSPYFVQLQNKDELVLAKSRMARYPSNKLTEHLMHCMPYQGTWRSADERDGFSLLSLQSYLKPPEETQIAFPREFWESTW